MHSTIDLHTHTSYSDGALTTTELLQRARQLGITTISITDHDTIEGVAEAITLGSTMNITVIPGIELSVTFNQREVHILGYYFNPHNEELQECLSLFHDQRIQRAERMVNKIRAMNIPIDFDEVLRQAGKGVVCRPHIAQVMVNNNYVSSYYEVFNKYIGDSAPAYERKPEFRLEKAVEILDKACGLTFLAHPASSFSARELAGMITAGIDGIETVHPSHTVDLLHYYKGIVHQYYLLECGGSDFHGGYRGDDQNLGRYSVPSVVVDRMLQRLGR